MIFTQSFLYLSIVVLIVGILIKAIKIYRMPAHLRWELYPIPHEKGRGEYGGSYYEEFNWWTKPRDVSYMGEVKEMGREIFAIQTLFRNNRLLWYFSFPFHLGLYFLTAFIGLIFFGAFLGVGAANVSAIAPNMIDKVQFYLTILSGGIGFTLSAVGAAGLLLLRIFRSDLRRYSTRADYFNLLLLLAICAIGFLNWLTLKGAFFHYHQLAQNLVRFSFSTTIPMAIQIHIILVALFFIYLPFTHMTHFVGKYFTFHSVRWQDQPTKAGDKIESGISKALKENLSWSASHINPGKTWGETATGNDPPEDK